MDRVKPLKIETAIDGTQSDPFPVEANPAQDYIAAKGISFENTADKIFDLSASGEVQWKDAIQTTYKKLNDIATLAQAARFTITLLNNSTLSNGQRFTYSEVLPTTQIIVPMNCSLKALTFANTVANADWSFEIRKYTVASGYTSFTSLFTWAGTNTQTASRNDRSDAFLAGDEIRVIFTDTGDNPSDASMMLFFQAT